MSLPSKFHFLTILLAETSRFRALGLLTGFSFRLARAAGPSKAPRFRPVCIGPCFDKRIRGLTVALHDRVMTDKNKEAN